jgi:hypothetical protein
MKSKKRNKNNEEDGQGNEKNKKRKLDRSDPDFNAKLEKCIRNGFGSNDDDKFTPPEFLRAIARKYGKGLHDPCPEYGYHEAIKDPLKDGLRNEWGKRNWVNPPFSNIQPWVEKVIIELNKGNTSIVLLPTRYTALYWKKYIFEFAADIYLLNKQLCFGTHTTPSPFPLTLLVFDPLREPKHKKRQLSDYIFYEINHIEDFKQPEYLVSIYFNYHRDKTVDEYLIYGIGLCIGKIVNDNFEITYENEWNFNIEKINVMDGLYEYTYKNKESVLDFIQKFDSNIKKLVDNETDNLLIITQSSQDDLDVFSDCSQKYSERLPLYYTTKEYYRKPIAYNSKVLTQSKANKIKESLIGEKILGSNDCKSHANYQFKFFYKSIF